MIWIAAASCAIWIYLLVGHKGFWRADQRLRDAEPKMQPTIVAIVPARNEEESISACLSGLRGQSYDGPFSVVLVNDSSTDQTEARAKAVAAEAAGHPLQILNAPALEPGWTGKLWALNHGVTLSAEHAPDYFWFTDADIVHEPNVLSRLVAKAETENRGLVSLMVKLHCETLWERLFVPSFVFFFQKLYPFPAVNNDDDKTAGAAGGCILIKCKALDAIGGLGSLSDALIDDCTLAQRVKEKGFGLWLGLGEQSHSLRVYTGLGEIWAMVTRTAFTQLNYSITLLAGTLVGMSLIYLTGPICLLTGLILGEWTLSLLGGASCAFMALAYAPTLRYYSQPLAYGLGLPAVALVYTLMTLDSARRHWFGKGATWKARDYAETR